MAVKPARTENDYSSSHKVEVGMYGTVPQLPTRLVAWCLTEHLANFHSFNTSATSTIRTTIATNTNTNIGVAAVGKFISVRGNFWRKQGMLYSDKHFDLYSFTHCIES